MAGEDAARGGARGGARGRGAPRGRARGGRARRGGAAAPPADTSASDVQMTDAPANAQPEASTPQPSTTPSTPASLTSRAAPARGGPSSSTSARGGAAAGRFLPRAIRRSQLDRETIAAQETAKQETKAAVDARLQRAARGGRGGGRRARGGPPTGFDRIIRGGAGGFGSTIQASSSRATPSAFGSLYDAPSAGGSGSGGSGSGVKREHGALTRDTESSRPTGRRMNTDKIAEFVTIEDNEPTGGAAAAKGKDSTPTTLLPKGMFREEPVESDQPAIATTEEVEAAERGEAAAVEVVPVSSAEGSDEDGDLFNDNDVEMKDDGRKWPGAKDAPQVKIEGEEITEIDMLTRRRAEKKREAKEAKKKLKFADEEDRLDAEKLAYQRKLFGVASDDDVDDDDEEAESKEKVKAEERKPLIAEGSIYLWQFPPVMPPLHKVERAAKKSLVKDEPNDDVVMLNAPAHSSNTPVDLTAADEVKEEGDADDAGNDEPEEEPSGFVGKLIIRKSGKMQIDWGGMLFDCETGIAVSHYREAVLTEEDDEKQPDGFHGTAYGMGAIAGKFNAVPHWSDVEPWVVDDSQLPPWGIDAAPEGTVMEN